MVRARCKLVHFLDVDTRLPLCADAGDGVEPPAAAGQGVSVCAECARRMAEQLKGRDDAILAPGLT